MTSVTDALPGESMLTVTEVAKILRVSKMTVYRFVHSGELASVRVGRSIRIPLVAAKAFFEGGSSKP